MSKRLAVVVCALGGAALLACGSDGATSDPEGTVDVAGPDGALDAAGDVSPDGDGSESHGDGADGAEPGCPTEGEACDDQDPCTTGDMVDETCTCAGNPDPCDDDLVCTTDGCDEAGCTHSFKSGYCLGGAGATLCVKHLDADPANTCRLCNANAPGGAGWTVLVDGAPCNDGDLCTDVDACEVGTCVGKVPVACHTENPCAEPACDPIEGCVELPIEGSCSDGNPCTIDDTCVDGVCVGGIDAPVCDDDDVCTVGDSCLAGVCVSGASGLDCDDEDACTLDLCDPATGCYQAPACNDGDPCTTDSCADGLCSAEPHSGPCEDGKPCTVGETCIDGVCGGGAPNSCDDGNPCTTDSCSDTMGCANYFMNDVGCNDGNSCTFPDWCMGGICVGNKVDCPVCPIPVTDHANKVTLFELSSDGFTGSGLDVDLDPGTCAPAGGCDGGIDNALADLAFLVNDPMTEAVAGGGLIYVIDLDQATLDGQPFTMTVLDADLTEASAQAGCQFQSDVCAYTANQSNYDGFCNPFFSFNDATIQDYSLKAGGKGNTITILLALTSDVSLPLVIGHARFEGTIELNEGGDKVVGFNGVLGGATPKAQLIATIENLDDDVLPLPTEDVVELLDILVDNDIDLDGDGIKDAASVGLRVKTIGATLGY